MTQQRLTDTGQNAAATISALIIHGIVCGMKLATIIPRTIPLTRPGINAAVRADIEWDPKRTVPNGLGRACAVGSDKLCERVKSDVALLSFFFTGCSLPNANVEQVNRSEHDYNVKLALRQVCLTIESFCLNGLHAANIVRMDSK